VGYHIVLIMAAGGGTTGTWHSETWPNKHILPIGGEPLVARAARQVEELSGIRPIVLTPWPEVQKVVPLYFAPAWYASYTDTFVNSWIVWNNANRVTVLNGDVVWHPDVLEFILVDQESPRLYGDTLGQIYAWAFNKNCTGLIIHAAQRMNSYSQVHFFRQLCGCTQLRECEFFKFVPPGTYTRDFDVMEDYENWLKDNPTAEMMRRVREVTKATIIEQAAIASTNMKNIPGWMQPNEAAILAIYARDRVVFEIGCYQGRSTVAMAPLARHVYCIDHFHPDSVGQGYDPDTPGVRAEFDKNTSEWADKITVFEMTSHEAAKRNWPSLGMIFIDGGHEYDTVTHDIAAFIKYLVPGGIIALHDTDKPGVAQALEESTLIRDDWEELRGLGTVRAFVKR
jgi:predicted O-methyltransferase YrrM